VSFLLDTNVISEWTKPQPDRNVISWLAEVDEDRVFISVISFAEVRHGVELLPPGRRRERLARWLAEELPERFEDRILAIDQPIAETWGVVMARSQKAGLRLGSMDAFVAATAETRALTLVTRNVKDFDRLGVSLFDPWASHP
jgi:predicted nucleic acid-binding protein